MSRARMRRAIWLGRRRPPPAPMINNVSHATSAPASTVPHQAATKLTSTEAASAKLRAFNLRLKLAMGTAMRSAWVPSRVEPASPPSAPYLRADPLAWTLLECGLAHRTGNVFHVTRVDRRCFDARDACSRGCHRVWNVGEFKCVDVPECL
jgi:hypothetical protein